MYHNGKEHERVSAYIHTHTAESLCYTPESDAILQINYFDKETLGSLRWCLNERGLTPEQPPAVALPMLNPSLVPCTVGWMKSAASGRWPTHPASRGQPLPASHDRLSAPGRRPSRAVPASREGDCGCAALSGLAAPLSNPARCFAPWCPPPPSSERPAALFVPFRLLLPWSSVFTLKRWMAFYNFAHWGFQNQPEWVKCNRCLASFAI